MPQYGFFEQLFARDPRSLARFPDLPIDQALIEWRRLNEKLAEAAVAPESPPPPPPAPALGEDMDAVICALATNVWRTKTKMIDATTGEPREETKRIYRHVESTIEALAQMGVSLNDWLNQPYDSGLPLKVLTFQPMPGMERDTVIEALRPNVIWKDRLLQLGEVIVGVPEPAISPATASTTPESPEPLSP